MVEDYWRINAMMSQVTEKSTVLNSLFKMRFHVIMAFYTNLYNGELKYVTVVYFHDA